MVVPLKLTHTAYQGQAQVSSSERIQTALRFFQQARTGDSTQMFFECAVDPLLFFTAFAADTASKHYNVKSTAMSAVSTKCQLSVQVRGSCSASEVVERGLTRGMRSRLMKQMRSGDGREHKLIYMLLLQLKCLLVCVCIRDGHAVELIANAQSGPLRCRCREMRVGVRVWMCLCQCMGRPKYFGMQK